jgi:hypothetical protein
LPNFVEELGWRAEWQHNRKQFITKMATKVAAVVLVAALLSRKKSK